MGTTRTHLKARAVTGGGGHARGGAGHSGVKVQDGQQVGFEDARLGKGGLNLQNGGVGEEGLTLGVAADVAAEAEGFQEGEGLLVDDVAGGEERELFVGESEFGESLEEAAGACKDAVAAACGQAAGEDLEGALALGGSGSESCLEHGQLVVIGEKRSSSHVSNCRGERGRFSCCGGVSITT